MIQKGAWQNLNLSLSILPMHPTARYTRTHTASRKDARCQLKIKLATETWEHVTLNLLSLIVHKSWPGKQLLLTIMHWSLPTHNSCAKSVRTLTFLLCKHKECYLLSPAIRIWYPILPVTSLWNLAKTGNITLELYINITSLTSSMHVCMPVVYNKLALSPDCYIVA